MKTNAVSQKRFIGVFVILIASWSVAACSPNTNPVYDSTQVTGKRLSFPPAFYQSIVYIDGRLLGFTDSLARKAADRVSYAYEGDPVLHSFDPLHEDDCGGFSDYAIKGLLPDGRIGFLGCGTGSRWSIFAMDWQTGKVERLVWSLVEGYSAKDFTWNPEMTRGVQEMVDAAQGTIYWIWRDGIGPMDVEIEDQGLKWNLKYYYEHYDEFKPGTGYVLSPAWSPDGKTIAFLASTYGMRETPQLIENITYEVYFMDPTELKPVQILKGIVNAFRIRWSPDSQYLLLGGCAGVRQKCGLWIYSLNNKSLTLVTEGEFENYTWVTNEKVVAIKSDIDKYLEASEVWEYPVDKLLKP